MQMILKIKGNTLESICLQKVFPALLYPLLCLVIQNEENDFELQVFLLKA